MYHANIKMFEIQTIDNFLATYKRLVLVLEANIKKCSSVSVKTVYTGSTDIYMQMPPSLNNFWNKSAVFNNFSLNVIKFLMQ